MTEPKDNDRAGGDDRAGEQSRGTMTEKRDDHRVGGLCRVKGR